MMLGAPLDCASGPITTTVRTRGISESDFESPLKSSNLQIRIHERFLPHVEGTLSGARHCRYLPSVPMAYGSSFGSHLGHWLFQVAWRLEFLLFPGHNPSTGLWLSADSMVKLFAGVQDLGTLSV